MHPTISPQIRSYLYGIALAVIPILVVTGTIVGDDAQMWLYLAAAVLGVPAAGTATAYRPTKTEPVEPEPYID